MRRLKNWLTRKSLYGKKTNHGDDLSANIGLDETSSLSLSLSSGVSCFLTESGERGQELHDKIIRNDIDGCRNILASGLDPNKPFYFYHKALPTDSNGRADRRRVETRFLHMAIIYRRPGVVQALLEAGASPNITDSSSRYPLQLAITYWPRVDYNLPTQAADRDIDKFQRYLSDQHTSSQRTFGLLLTKGAKADVTCGNNSTHTLLHLAAQYGIKDSVGCLVRSGAHLDAVNKEGETALMLALKKGHTHVADTLITCGADVGYADGGGKTALHYCCCLPRAALTVRLLLKYGACADATDSHGNTALHLAAMENNEASVRILLEADARPDPLTDLGETPLFLLLDAPRALAAPARLPLAELLAECSLCLRLTNAAGKLAAHWHQLPTPLAAGGATEPASLFNMALYRTRRCLGYSATSRIREVALQCPPGLKELIAWR